MIAIIDYGVGNLFSLKSSLAEIGAEAVVTSDEKVIAECDRIILPGVGAFGDAMEKIRSYGLESVIREVVKRRTPFLGICLGLQLLFEKSEESPGVEGLSILEGEILRIPDENNLKIPHIGWNSLSFPNQGRLFKGIEEEAYVYFVHSYYLNARDKDIVTATAEYGAHIEASVEKGNIFACQFHPEKSSEVGLKIIRNFIELDGKGE